MYIEDLTQLPPNHPPSPYNFPVFIQRDNRWGKGLLEEGLILYTVGWLGDFVPSEGKTPSECITRLCNAYKAKLAFSDGTGGWHNCELCHTENEWYPGGKVGPIINWQNEQIRLYGHGHFIIRHNVYVYLFPALILHYILDHGYKPPETFIEAVRQGKFLTTNDLVWVENGAS
ncbi:MAG: hypothetical protein JEZ06_20010 [Anaerolineaceae bacterium]|nr:hypothetical protein [Anaerolineaceae bacterium]